MAAELVFQLSTLVPVDPAEDPWVVLWCRTVGYPVGPVLREAVLPGGGFQSRRAQTQLHQHVRFAVLGVVPPQRGQRFFHATFTCKNKAKQKPIVMRSVCIIIKAAAISMQEMRKQITSMNVHRRRLCHSKAI